MLIRNPTPSESQILMNLAEATGVFQPDEVTELLGSTLSSFHAGTLGDQHQIKVATQEGTDHILAWSYFAPSQYASGVWDVWWIGAHPEVHGQGVGRQMLALIESEIRTQGGRVIVIETSSLPPLERARKFYPRSGYKECGRIADFYGIGDSKVIFAKTL